MLPGPVFTFELMTTARRGRFYLIRASYAAILLVVLWTIHSAWLRDTGGELSYKLVNWFAFSTFCAIAIGQEVLVLILTPALVAGMIADEKKRKTLHYLMASQLSSAEIVVGKLLARMLYVVVLLGVSLPVLSLLVLLGGIDPWLVVLACGATLSTAWFLASLSIWVSTIARRPREALFIAFGLECLWLCVPLMTRTVPGWPVVDDVVMWLREWVGASNPVDVVWRLFWGVMVGGLSRQSEIQLITWMIGLQAGSGLVLATLAALQLRPIFRRQSGAAEVRDRRGLRSILRSWRLRRHPALGDRPMLWKELHTGGARGLTWFIGLLLTLIGGSYLAYYTVWIAGLAFSEWWIYGNGPRVGSIYFNSERGNFRWFIQRIAPLLYLVGILKVAGTAAGAITSEHEEDTWVSMTATDLTGREIIFAKLVGALGRGRQLAEVIVALAVAGVVAGALHMLSIPALIVGLGVYGWFAAALGVWISLQLRSSWRAQFLTIAILLLINLTGQGLLNAVSDFGFSPQIWPGFTPYEVNKLVFDPHFVGRLAGAGWPHSWRIRSIENTEAWRTIFGVLSVLTYTTLATLLTWDCLRRFEIVAGRARRSRQGRQAEPARGDKTGADFQAEQPSLAGTTL